MKILITGATGFIGSHTCVELLNAGFKLSGIDNFCNSKPIVTDYIKKISGKNITIYKADIRNESDLREVFEKESPECVIHFAGLKSISESMMFPLTYYDNNAAGTVCLCKIMKEFKVKKIIFSSSASVYGKGKAPFTENSPVFPDFLSLDNKINTYAKTKFMVEQILFDTTELDVVILRYFNPVGSHKLLCENPNGVPNNLMPRILQFAAGETDEFIIFGNNYPTPDGTCIRDYIHITDLALGHVAALKFITSQTNNKKEVFNLGTGKGTSTLELVKIFEKTNGIKLNYKFGQRRPGDADVCYASTEKSQKLLNWQAKFDVPKMCFDAWEAKLFSKKQLN